MIGSALNFSTVAIAEHRMCVATASSVVNAYGCGGTGERIVNELCELGWDGVGLAPTGHPDQPRGWKLLSAGMQQLDI